MNRIDCNPFWIGPPLGSEAERARPGGQVFNGTGSRDDASSRYQVGVRDPARLRACPAGPDLPTIGQVGLDDFLKRLESFLVDFIGVPPENPG